MLEGLTKVLSERETTPKDRLYLGVVSLQDDSSILLTGQQLDLLTFKGIGKAVATIPPLTTQGKIPEDTRFFDLLVSLNGKTVQIYFSVGTQNDFLAVTYEGKTEVFEDFCNLID